MKKIFLGAALAVLSVPAGASLPEGSFRGTSWAVRGNDVLGLLIKKDPKDAKVHWAILAEYERVDAPGPERLQITRWVPRIYAYRVEELTPESFALRLLRVSAAGEIEADPAARADGLTLKKKGSMEGAVITRYDNGGPKIAESINFKGRVSSTWEKFVPGTYYGSKDSTGGDYFKKDINTTISKDQLADFTLQDIQGRFQMTEKAPGLFTLRPVGDPPVGKDKAVTLIGAFVDIVNWKPVATTDELLLINPADPKDIGFFYERH